MKQIKIKPTCILVYETDQNKNIIALYETDQNKS